MTFDGLDQSGVNETVPYASKWLCHYPHTKALAEMAVIDAHQPGRLSTVALRPHLIWGEDDPHLFPRLLQRAREKRLVIVGAGVNIVDSVHVINAAGAHLDALDSLVRSDGDTGGRPYFITQDEPVECWQWISDVCQIGGVDPPQRRISFRAAYAVGAALEVAFRASPTQERAADDPVRGRTTCPGPLF